jgi:hypothetical protein
MALSLSSRRPFQAHRAHVLAGIFITKFVVHGQAGTLFVVQFPFVAFALEFPLEAGIQ